ncbi:LPXTG cell wall anchor domain-containing protein [Bifidobacterium sp. UMB1197]|nr:LPXTG cell wall anchor domain-containing protein [Bifidobacterium sp. UMB1197]
MNKRTVLVLSTTMMSIATAACAFCVSQTANAVENVTSAAAVVNVNSNVANPGFNDGGYPFAKNPDKAKGDAGSKGVDSSKNDVNSKNANIPNNGAVNSNVKDDSSANDSSDVKKSKVAVYKSAQSTKEVSKEDKAAVELPANVENQSEVKPNKEGIYDFSNDKDIKNPFPNVITPAEVKELQDKTTSGYPFSYIIKSFYTPAGKEFKVVNGKPVGDTQEFTYQIQNTYENMLGRIDNYIFIPSAKEAYGGEGEIRPYRSSREFRNDDGSLSLDDSKAPDTVIPYTLEINGKFIGKDRTTKTPFEYYMNRNQTFVHMTMHGRKADEIIYGVQSLNYMGSSAAPGLFAFIPECGAQFHFVDDLQYRKVANIKGNGELSQRSTDGADRFSAKPFTKLAITDLQDSSNVSNVKFTNNAIANYFVPLLSYECDPKKDSVKRPTMDELKKTNIPGYLYYSNDIDTPEDGTFTKDNTKKFGNYDYGIVRNKDDNQVTTKHYYVTFRVIPTQLVVKYKKIDGTFESNAKYELLDSKNTQISNEFAAAISDVTASSKDALAAMMKSTDTTFLKGTTGYLSNGAVYLLPGKYTVKPIVKAPEGYEWVVDSTEQNSKTSADINIGLQIGDAVVAKSVTFVLKKKPTPPTPPAPTPEPTPEPEPEPTPVPVPDFPVPIAPAPILPPAEAEPEPAPAPSQPEQPEQQPKHVAKHLPKTGSTATPILASAIASLFAGLAGLASLGATLKRHREN